MSARVPFAGKPSLNVLATAVFARFSPRPMDRVTGEFVGVLYVLEAAPGRAVRAAVAGSAGAPGGRPHRAPQGRAAPGRGKGRIGARRRSDEVVTLVHEVTRAINDAQLGRRPATALRLVCDSEDWQIATSISPIGMIRTRSSPPSVSVRDERFQPFIKTPFTGPTGEARAFQGLHTAEATRSGRMTPTNCSR